MHICMYHEMNTEFEKVTKEENFRRPIFNLPDVGMMRRLHAKYHIESILRGVCSRNIRRAQAFSEHPQCMGTKMSTVS
jgi:hypothetical protein